jgi:hypothetical protein
MYKCLRKRLRLRKVSAAGELARTACMNSGVGRNAWVSVEAKWKVWVAEEEWCVARSTPIPRREERNCVQSP